MNSMPFRQLKSFLKILIGVQYDSMYPKSHGSKKVCDAAGGMFPIYEKAPGVKEFRVLFG